MHLMLKVALFLRDEESFKYDLIPIDITILTILASHIGNNSSWRISQDEIAKECRIKPSYFRRRCRRLCEYNLINITHTGKANSYTITLPKIENKPWNLDRYYSTTQSNNEHPDRYYSTTLIGTIVPPRPVLEYHHNINNKDNNKKALALPVDNFKNKKQNQEQKSLVQEWGPGHPSYDALHPRRKNYDQSNYLPQTKKTTT